MKKLLMAAALSFSPCLLSAQAFDPQVRLLMHSHVVAPAHKLGIATWTILPDVTDRNLKSRNPKRLLFVAGLLVRSNTTSDYNWLEVMPGALVEIHPVTKAGKIHMLLNTRAYLSWPRADLYLENHLRSDRLLFSAFATRPFRIRRLSGRFGGESEAIVGLKPEVPNIFLLGPRLSVRLKPPWLNVATAVYLNQDADLVWRTYLKSGK
ncbi:MAG: hypothetical protein A3H72_01820 [Candidatus Doudnabacteria bacterium RIFCSPLOWO2_02_FULL_48_8]|uniref:DUF4390 domain-containing protein n=1 Tax=Candidatus Doudnabacteria bacterium RIFCSPHIGHO2_01_FULL_46_24 TaxID=1817825 RepID=A0A1F5NWA6_9BACT|nr:MAG: hypothetical protein A2720_00215 [Candidatus Doudnabacteria bacterium RIFCSPHIGHO2_01_FULL_46_24]OGE94974.1 MAG: hypothetical protein A3H72_01820 [Candidatus Doudnabacteria bacterium RIFCSPLOWO2_02_FULL_48_8]